MNTQDLIKQTLLPLQNETGLNVASDEARTLLYGTILVESWGVYRYQIGGIAIGICQIEPATHKDTLKRCRNKQLSVFEYILKCFYPDFKYTDIWDIDFRLDNFIDDNLLLNDEYSIIIARMKYYLIPEKLPKDIQGLAEYWKKYYNTELGKGEVGEFIKRTKEN
jgi:hypothetical protein